MRPDPECRTQSSRSAWIPTRRIPGSVGAYRNLATTDVWTNLSNHWRLKLRIGSNFAGWLSPEPNLQSTGLAMIRTGGTGLSRFEQGSTSGWQATENICFFLITGRNNRAQSIYTRPARYCLLTNFKQFFADLCTSKTLFVFPSRSKFQASTSRLRPFPSSTKIHNGTFPIFFFF